MSYHLTIAERMVLESLQIKQQDTQCLQIKTGLEDNILKNVLSSLLEKNLITFKESRYSIILHHNQYIKEELNNSKEILAETQEIINSCLRQRLQDKSKSCFKLKKVNMTEREKKIYKGLIYNVEAFLNSLDKSEDVKSQQLIFWGEGNYAEIKDNIFSF